MQYENLNQLWLDTLTRIMIHGDGLDSRAGKTKEVLGFQATLIDPLNNILLGFPERKFSLSYACAEMLWYLSGTSSIKMIEAYAPQYKNFAEDGKAYGAYGERWKNNPGFIKETNIFFNPCQNGKNQLEALIHLLKDKPNTRQAIITMWDSGDLLHAILGDHKDLPCTVSLKFYVRHGKLYLIADMRSNDAWLGLPYDIFCFTMLQRIIANELQLELGNYIHQVGSEHLYERNFEGVKKILAWTAHGSPDYCSSFTLIEGSGRFSLEGNIRQALRFERHIRDTHLSYKNFGQILELESNLYPVNNLFHDLVTGCATKWIDVHPQHFYNPLFQEWQEQNLKK